ncbi:MAG: HAD family hydrolase [Prevotella sp.]|nr:HAD family hydrolase [Prevotella sp.]MBQ9203092.1 HAD family hydrolase [Prevotella sp.]
MNTKIKVIAFDADDTLWDCQSWFDDVERRCCELLAPWATAREVSEGLFATERANLSLTGYGTKAFTLSLIENAVRVSGGQLTGDIVMRLIEMGKELLRFPTTPLPEVEETLARLAAMRSHRLVVFTKGELMDQEGKLRRSGLEQYFSHVETVSNKTEREYRQLCENLGVAPEETVMVGNSFRSDIAPALTAGAWAVHIPYHVVWELEKSEEYPHERLHKITHFSQLLDVI